MTGRESELKSLKDILQSCQIEGKIAVSITGIGGIGYVTQSPNERLGILKTHLSRCPQLTLGLIRKTATLLEIAHQNADKRNIFFVHANDAASLHQAYLHIAKCIGPEYLLKEYRGQDLQGIWSNESATDKVRKFKMWLKDPENANALFLLDDMDGIQLLEHREAAFPDEAKTILYTTRNPVFYKDSIRSRHKVRLSAMKEEVSYCEFSPLSEHSL
jgi:hypothetical protein